MTLIFNNHSFKYELESIVKLFFQAQLFTHLFDERNADGDICFTHLKKGRCYTYFFCFVRIGSEKVRLSSRLKNDISDYKSGCELELSRLLFSCLEHLTGISPKWGLITGVRPVKRVNGLLSEGKTKKEIFQILKEKFLVKNEKCELAYETAKTQRNIIESLDDRSFSLYVSIPFCPTRCAYCSFVSESMDKAKELIPLYVENLCCELKYISGLVNKLKLRLDTVYFGGGTPTSIEAFQLEKIMRTVSDCFDFSYLREYTVEAGRADTITEKKLEIIKKNGAARISINPQTLNDSVLKAIKRNHTAEQFFESFSLARRLGFDNINTDLIAGLPTDTLESFKKTINGIILLSPENVTVHTLSIKRAAELNRKPGVILENPAPEMVDYAISTLTKAGYSPYYLYRQKNMMGNLENTGFSKAGKESLYNVYIMEELQTIIAAGAGASTKLVGKNSIERVFNYKHPLEYNNHFELMLEKKKAITEFYESEGKHE
ncbi:MAG: coproporphyrinogen dehydrogenase HemZ [Oscillospiraceae bacterium]|jgi:oxygen-independent coproporphyrinogen-3 oxidase